MGSTGSSVDRRRLLGSFGGEVKPGKQVQFEVVGIQTAFLLDHDLVPGRSNHLNRGRYPIPRPGMVVGMALEKLSLNLLNHLRRLGSFFLGDPARRFASASAVLTLSLAIVLSSEVVNDWHSYQRQFLKLVRTRPAPAPLKRRFERGIPHIWIPEQGIVDRSTTSHLGLKEVSLADVPEQPFPPHPTIPHSLTDFGCVTCHRGQGAATTVEEAHASTKAWEQPLLPAKYLES